MKKPRWIIQDNLISENDSKEIQNNLKKRGVAFYNVQVIPFSDELPDFPIDDDHENIYYGSTTFINNLKKQLNPLGVFFDPDSFTAKEQQKHWKDHMLNTDAEIMTIKEWMNDYSHYVQRVGYFFVRPNGDGKEFNGTVGTEDQIYKVLSGILHNDEKVDDSFEILVGEAFRLGREWRTYIVGDEVVTFSQYRNNHVLSKKRETPPEVISFVKDRLKEYRPHDIFAMDICEFFEEGKPRLAILECGCMNSVGFYLCDKEAYLKGIEEWIMTFSS